MSKLTRWGQGSKQHGWLQLDKKEHQKERNTDQQAAAADACNENLQTPLIYKRGNIKIIYLYYVKDARKSQDE